jgi:predicted Zn-ribbon and HTH transcriptional regulator
MRKCKCGTILESKAPQCKECARIYMTQRRKEAINKGTPKHDVYNYKWRKDNPEAYMLHSAKCRAKKLGWEFNLTVEDIKIPSNCPVLGIPLFIRQGGKGTEKNPNNPSLDRIDSSKGYIKGNIKVISWRANDLKKNGSLSEFIKIVEYLNAEERRIQEECNSGLCKAA